MGGGESQFFLGLGQRIATGDGWVNPGQRSKRASNRRVDETARRGGIYSHMIVQSGFFFVTLLRSTLVDVIYSWIEEASKNAFTRKFI
jgi:hypothetical protein